MPLFSFSITLSSPKLNRNWKKNDVWLVTFGTLMTSRSLQKLLSGIWETPNPTKKTETFRYIPIYQSSFIFISNQLEIKSKSKRKMTFDWKHSATTSASLRAHVVVWLALRCGTRVWQSIDFWPVFTWMLFRPRVEYGSECLTHSLYRFKLC